MTTSLPHPIPYQGSKRNLADRILSFARGQRRFKCLHEPFAGSAAITIAAAHADLAEEFVIGDSLSPLTDVWRAVVDTPRDLADEYEQLWCGQESGGDGYYNLIREQFNEQGGAARLLYLLARCVKNSPRFNRKGRFNQSHDRRRLGRRPPRMRAEIEATSALLKGRTRVVSGDFEPALKQASADDLVYLDPPWEGTTVGVDKRYHQGLDRARLVTALERLNKRGVPFILSYDGRCGDKTYGEPLPPSIGVRHELEAGRSSQATLNGRTDVTVESLYVSRSIQPCAVAAPEPVQLSLLAFAEIGG